MDVLLVGGGHAMLPVLSRAPAYAASGAAVTLLSASRYFYYSGMVPEYLGGVYTRDAVRIDLKRLCHSVGVRFVHGTATTVAPAARTVATASGRRLSYDLAAFDIGTRPPGLPSGAAAPIPTKPLHRIERLEKQVRTILAGEAATPLRLAIAGGGAAGVEIALNLTARFHAQGRGPALRLTIVEPSARLLPAFPPGMSRQVTRLLRRRGAQCRFGRRAEHFASGRLLLASSRAGAHNDTHDAVPADAVLWATGPAAPPLFAEADLPTDDGFVRVRRSLRVRGHPRLFAAGDCAYVDGYEHLARVGVHAVKQGPVLAENLARACRHAAGPSPSQERPVPEGALKTFTPYAAAPLLLSTGAPTALWTARGLWFAGRPVLRLKHWLDRRWMRPYHSGRWRSAGLRDWLRADAALPHS